MENCKVIVGIDVSSKDSTVCVLMDKVRQGKTFKISNDMVGFQQLYKSRNRLKQLFRKSLNLLNYNIIRHFAPPWSIVTCFG